MPAVFSAGGGAVSSETAIITIMQNIHAHNARWLKVLKFLSSSFWKSTQLKMNPVTIVVSAAVPLARFHKTPSVNTTANGGAMKKNTVCTFSKSVSLEIEK